MTDSTTSPYRNAASPAQDDHAKPPPLPSEAYSPQNTISTVVAAKAPSKKAATPNTDDIHVAMMLPTMTTSRHEMTRAGDVAGVTIPEVLCLAWAATLRKYTRQYDVVFGTTVASTEVDNIDWAIAHHGIVPCRVHFDDTQSLAFVFKSMRAGKAMRDNASQYQQWSSRVDLIDTLFIVQNDVDDNALPRVYPALSLPQDDHEYALSLVVRPGKTNIAAHAMYNPSKIPRLQARHMLDEFDHTLSHLVQLTHTAQSTTTASLWSLSPSQSKLIESAMFGPTIPLPFELVHHAFEARAKEFPDLRAIEFEGQWLTYGQLNN
ncbi:hypothetical protein As57867_002063, partial [Aphanomyces stellatus]